MIKIYYANINLIDKDLINKYNNKEKYLQMSNENKRKEQIVRDILLDYVIKKENISESIVYNKYGKPDFSNFNKHFNISHSGNFVIIAISNYEIGIDIQKIVEYDDMKLNKMIKHIYSDNDYNYYNQNDNITFSEIWSIKEAYLKCIGIGLIKNIKDIYIDYENKNIVLKDNKILNYVSYVSNGYVMAIVCKEIDKIEAINYNKNEDK